MLNILKRYSLLIVIMLIIGVFGETKSIFAQTTIEDLEDNWVQPVQGKITDTFGTRSGNHKGIDIAAPEGTEINSVSDGVVTRSYYSDSYGHVVFVQHPEGYETVYAHLNKRLVNEGEKIKRGQRIGIIGNTGISTGTHLHFELHKGEWTYDKEHALDPLFVFELSNSNVTKHDQHSNHKHIEVNHKMEINESAKDKNHPTTIDKPVSKTENEEKISKTKIKIKQGDTLWAFSQKFNVTVEALQKWNQIESDLIYPGQEIVIYSQHEQSYVVKAGDTLQSIANEYKTDANLIKKENNLANEIIYPDQILVIKSTS